MGGDEREFKIKITTAADTSGAQKTSADMEKLGSAQEGAGKKAEKHGGHLRAMHRIFHSLNEVVPGLGVLMQAAFSPVGAAISGALIVLRLFQEKMKEINAGFQKMEEDAAKPATNRMAAWREAIVSAAAGMNQLRQALADAARGQETIKETTEHATTAFREQMQAASSLAEATQQNDLARLDEAHSAGLVSEQEYAQQRLEIEQEYQAKKRELQEREEMTEILLKKRALEEAEIAQPGLTSAAETAALKKVKALEDLGSLDKSGVEERKKSTAAALAEWEKKLNTPELLEQFAGIGTGKTQAEADRWMRAQATEASPYHTSGANRYMEWDALKTAAMGAEGEWKQFPKAEAERKVAADRASDEAARAEKAAVGNQVFITETGRDIGDHRSRFDARHRSNEEIVGLDQDTLSRRANAAALKSPDAKLIRDVSQAESILQRGGQISVGQQSQIATLAERMHQSQIQQGQAIIQALGTIHGNTEALTRQVLALARKLEAQGKWARNQASPP